MARSDGSGWDCWFWQATCLKPTYSLRRQVLVSFGITGIVTISIVVGLACFTAIYAGDHVRTEAREFMRDQVIASIVNSSQYAAETFSEELDHLRGTASLMVEITRDRIAGYPTRPGWDDDLFVPFQSYNGRNAYPLKTRRLPRDWNVTFNINAANLDEHLQELVQMMGQQQYHDHPHGEKEKFIPNHARILASTASASYFFQGNCDPLTVVPTNYKYFHNCTNANNNGTTGGVIWPTSTNAGLEVRAADIGLLLKPIWESRSDILYAGVYFANEGAGSMVHFPSFVHHNHPDGYVSIGCDWLHENMNPYTKAPFFSESTTSKCHPAGSWVNNREFNPLEQEWCRDQALHPNETRFYGPIIDDFFSPGALFKTHSYDLRLWVMKVGRAVFDRYTNEFIGCAGVDVLLNRFSDLMGGGPDSSRQLVFHNFSEAVLVRKSDGQVVAGGGWNSAKSNATIHVSETDLVPDESSFKRLLKGLQELGEQEGVWKGRRQLSGQKYSSYISTAVIECHGMVLSASLLPNTDFVFIQSVGTEIFDVVDGIKSKIDDDVMNLIMLALVIGLLGMIILMTIVWTVSMVLTKPLDWMRHVAWNIVNHTDSRVERDSLKVQEDDHEDGNDVGKGEENRFVNILRWTPKSEITELVYEFKKMIQGFSGSDYASAVANPKVHEVRNLLAWQSDFLQLYQTSKAPSDENDDGAALQNSFSNLHFNDESNFDQANEEVNEDLEYDFPMGGNGTSSSTRDIIKNSGSNERSRRRKSNDFGNGHSVRRCSGDSNSSDLGKNEYNVPVRENNIGISTSAIINRSGINERFSRRKSNEFGNGHFRRRSSDGSNISDLGKNEYNVPIRDNNNSGSSTSVIIINGSGNNERFRRRKSNEFGNGHFRRGSSGDSITSDKGRKSRDNNEMETSPDDIGGTGTFTRMRGSEEPGSEPEHMFRSSRTGHTDAVLKSEHAQPRLPSRQIEGESEEISAIANTSSTLQPVTVVNLRQGWKNKGRHTYSRLSAPNGGYGDKSRDGAPAVRSMLFRWILVLIVIPMLLTNVVIVVVVSKKITSVLPDWVNNVGKVSFEMAIDDLTVSSKLAALYAEAVLATPVRDLFLLTRLTGWLFAGAINRNSDTFTAMNTATEMCKYYEGNVESCPWYDDVFANAPCDCKWEDPPAPNCFLMGNKLHDTRSLQKLFFAGQAHDAEPVRGARFETSYPEVDTSPETTLWWKNVSEVPGSWQGATASGHYSTYDRLRVFSAASVLVFPLYNYRPALVARGENAFLGVYFSFDSDGTIGGWSGCKHPSSGFAFFQSSDANLAYKINETLCPKGKFGFDPRCRNWYDAGRLKARNLKRGSSSLHIAAPYEHASTGSIASSATQAVVDPRTGKHVGQALIDFLQFEIHSLAPHQDTDFYIVITPSEETGGGDTVLAPDHKPGSTTVAIGDILLENDATFSRNRYAFDEIVKKMKEGRTGIVNFTRTNDDGDAETIWMAYDPIFVRALDPIKNDDYSRGVTFSQTLVYSQGAGRSRASMERPFEEFRRREDVILNATISIYIALAVLVSFFVTALTYQISVAVTKPMTTLLAIVRNINARRIDDDIPPLYGGSREVNQVYTSFAKLYKVVRVSNTAFFSGNLTWACHFVRDALKLFNKVDDQKAVAIASNNLGNILLAMSCSRPKEHRSSCLEVHQVCAVKEAASCYETAIVNATKEFANARDLNRKLGFAEQLADRHFNRGLFLLMSQSDPCCPEDAEELGYQDLMKAHALDHDIQEYVIKNKVLPQHSSLLYERLLRRIYGLIALLENDIEQQLWDPNELVYDCHRLLSAAWDDFTAPLFQDLDRIGRLQQLEGAMVQLELQRNNDIAATRLAIRMLVEDEFLNETAFQYAGEAILQYIAKDGLSGSSWSILSKASAQRDIEKMLKSCKQASRNKRKCLLLCLDLGNLYRKSEDDMNRLSKLLLSMYDFNCGEDDLFGMVVSNGSNGSTVQMDIECKRHKLGNEHHQRSDLENVMSSLHDDAHHPSPNASLEFRIITKPLRTSRALASAVDKVIDSEATSNYDSYILFITDGPKRQWDWKTLFSMKSRIEDINAQRKGDIHLIYFDLEEEQRKEEDRNVSSDSSSESDEEKCRNLCDVSQGSMYIRSCWGSLEDGFDEVRSLVYARNASSTTRNNALMSGITMEKF